MAKNQNALMFTGDEQTYITRYNEIIANPETAGKLARISATEAITAFAGIKQAYFMNSVTDVEAKKEGFKTATEMIEKICGLKKSMIANYRTVGAMVTDQNGEFSIPEHLKGFSVTQLVEAKGKLGTVEKIETAVKDGEIDCTMSAKSIRENLTTQEQATEQKAKREADKRNADSRTAKKYAENNGMPICVTNGDGEETVIGYIIATVHPDAFKEYIASGFAYAKGATKTLAIREQ